ncbi:MAG: DUF1203 domain-containing protein, partial [Candidatus Eisenbacteria bacterium]
MNTDFRVVALAGKSFTPLFALDEDALRARGMRRVVADTKPGYPCRVSLEDAEPGERLLLLPFTHHDVDSPYRASGPIFVRERADTARPAINVIPLMLHHRLLSLRAYDAGGMLVAAEVTEGTTLDARIRHAFTDPAVAYLHLHNARPGCYNCHVER